MELFTYWETFANDNGFKDKGHYFSPGDIEKVKLYAKKRMISSNIRGWYIEDADGNILEKHTYAIC